MPTRRSFLALSAKLAATGIVLRGTLPAKPIPGLTYGVQMYMVRSQAASDLAGAFRSIKSAGFDSVELYPIAYHQPAAQLRALLADSGLTSISGHFDYIEPGKMSLGATVDFAHALGLEYLVCPMLPEEQKLSLDGFRKAATLFNQWGETAKMAGMQFAFHNHDYEFKPLGGSNGWSILMSSTDPTLVKLELDLFWLTTAGQDPAATLRQHADRAVLIHMKDRTAGAPTSYIVNEAATAYCTELGKGTIDWPRLLTQARQQGIRYAFLDQDDTRLPVFESMEQSRAYLRKLVS